MACAKCSEMVVHDNRGGLRQIHTIQVGDIRAALFATENGHIECLRYLVEERNTPLETRAARHAAENGELECLQYLVEECNVPVDQWVALCAAQSYSNVGSGCLEYLAETRNVLWEFTKGQCLEFARHGGIYVSDKWCLASSCGKASADERALCLRHAGEYIRILVDYGMCGDMAKLVTEFV